MFAARGALGVFVYLFMTAVALLSLQGEPWAVTPLTPRPLRQTTVEPDVDFGAQVTTGIQMSLAAGSNESGRRTLISGSSIDFGSVSFVHPDLISNGAAYLDSGNLILEAVVSVEVVFNGASAVTLDLSRLLTSANSFHKSSYALSINRSTVLTEVLDDPNKSRLSTLTETTSVPLRLAFEITPQQQGRLTDRFRLEATSQ